MAPMASSSSSSSILPPLPAIPLKPEYGPTLGRLLSPRWHAASKPVQALVLIACTAVLAMLIGAGLALENAHYSHGGPVPFSFSYRGLYRTAPAAGEYVQVRRPAHGPLKDSFAVGPLQLPPYTVGSSGELPLYAILLHRGPASALRGVRAARRGQDAGQHGARVRHRVYRSDRRPDGLRARHLAAARTRAACARACTS